MTSKDLKEAYLEGIHDEQNRVVEVVEGYLATIREAFEFIDEYSLLGGYVTIEGVETMLESLKGEIKGEKKDD